MFGAKSAPASRRTASCSRSAGVRRRFRPPREERFDGHINFHVTLFLGGTAALPRRHYCEKCAFILNAIHASPGRAAGPRRAQTRNIRTPQHFSAVFSRTVPGVFALRRARVKSWGKTAVYFRLIALVRRARPLRGMYTSEKKSDPNDNSKSRPRVPTSAFLRGNIYFFVALRRRAGDVWARRQLRSLQDLRQSIQASKFGERVEFNQFITSRWSRTH